ncbi:MAG TPA: hypothetical protein VG839_06150 [Asticcacaulis sp.]|nr:hypothetical protein [Asticcacaulis sp.]
MRYQGFLRTVCLAGLVTGLWTGVPAGAQTQTAAPAAKGEADTTNVTIFAKRRPFVPAATRGGQLAQIDPNRASSCAYGMTLQQVQFENISPKDTATDVALRAALKSLMFLSSDEAAQNYFNDMGVENPNAGAQAYLGTDPTMAGSGYGDTSPYGNAATAGDTESDGRSPANAKVTATEGDAGGCTPADAAAAAGRSDIARHDASMKQAFEAMDAGDYPKALALFKEGYNKIGYPLAASYLGKMYLTGIGTKQDVNEAIIWLKRAAEGRYDAADKLGFNPADPYHKNARVEAQIMLANIYLNGFGVPKSPKDARKWYAEAEKYGYVPAGFMLGKMAEAGYGGTKDPAGAVAYYQAAGEYGFAPAQYQLGQLYYSGADGVVQDKTKAGAWLLKAAKNGYPDALYAVARMYELGEGGAQADLSKALVYYKEAAVKGQVDAQLTLGTYLYTGEGGAPKDLATARQLFQAAAEQGEPQAMFNLGVMLVNGEGGPKDLVRAYCWFSIADKGGIGQAGAAMRELAGKMTPEERAQAEALLNPKAAK